eukprot:c25822_g1_i4 orf=586-1416(+)
MEGNSASPVGPRFWRPAAQRNIRNAWGGIKAQCAAWATTSANGLSAATALVNAHLSCRYMDSVDLGILKEMKGIREKAQLKLAYQQEDFLQKVISSYQDLVESISVMVKTKASMRTYVRGSAGGPLIEFSNEQSILGDTGDGGGIAVFATFSLSTFEMLADELVLMYQSELRIKCLLVSEFCSTVVSGTERSVTNWRERIGALFSDPTCEKNAVEDIHLEMEKHVGTSLNGSRLKGQQTREELQVYLTAWLGEVNINKPRIKEILAIVSEEMQVSL